MNNFDMKVESLYQLCREVQKQGKVTVGFNIVNFDTGSHLTVRIYNGLFEEGGDSVMYSISEKTYSGEEEFKKAKKHLEKILMEGTEND